MLKPPGILRRLAAGAWHVPAGFAFLLRRPRLWPLAIVPTLATAFCLLMGLIAGAFAGPWVDAALAPARGRLPDFLALLVSASLWVATIGAGLVLGLAFALLLSAPLLEHLSQRVETSLGETPSSSNTWGILESVQTGAYFLAAAPVVFLLALIPVLGTLLGALWGAHALSFQETSTALSRRGLDFKGRWRWHRRWLPESLGFGLAGLVILVVPLANILLAPLLSPVLTIGGTLLVLELEEEPPLPRGG
jgi:uncharacterized protein involved in cysteine biosynthesis